MPRSLPFFDISPPNDRIIIWIRYANNSLWKGWGDLDRCLCSPPRGIQPVQKLWSYKPFNPTKHTSGTILCLQFICPSQQSWCWEGWYSLVFDIKYQAMGSMLSCKSAEGNLWTQSIASRMLDAWKSASSQINICMDCLHSSTMVANYLDWPYAIQRNSHADYVKTSICLARSCLSNAPVFPENVYTSCQCFNLLPVSIHFECRHAIIIYVVVKQWRNQIPAHRMMVALHQNNVTLIQADKCVVTALNTNLSIPVACSRSVASESFSPSAAGERSGTLLSPPAEAANPLPWKLIEPSDWYTWGC